MGVALFGDVGRAVDAASISTMVIIMLVMEKLVQESSATGPEWGDDNRMVVPSEKDKLSALQSMSLPCYLVHPSPV